MMDKWEVSRNPPHFPPGKCQVEEEEPVLQNSRCSLTHFLRGQCQSLSCCSSGATCLMQPCCGKGWILPWRCTAQTQTAACWKWMCYGWCFLLSKWPKTSHDLRGKPGCVMHKACEVLALWVATGEDGRGIFLEIGLQSCRTGRCGQRAAANQAAAFYLGQLKK